MIHDNISFTHVDMAHGWLTSISVYSLHRNTYVSKTDQLEYFLLMGLPMSEATVNPVLKQDFTLIVVL